MPYFISEQEWAIIVLSIRKMVVEGEEVIFYSYLDYFNSQFPFNINYLSIDFRVKEGEEAVRKEY